MRSEVDSAPAHTVDRGADRILVGNRASHTLEPLGEGGRAHRRLRERRGEYALVCAIVTPFTLSHVPGPVRPCRSSAASCPAWRRSRLRGFRSPIPGTSASRPGPALRSRTARRGLRERRRAQRRRPAAGRNDVAGVSVGHRVRGQFSRVPPRVQSSIPPGRRPASSRPFSFAAATGGGESGHRRATEGPCCRYVTVLAMSARKSLRRRVRCKDGRTKMRRGAAGPVARPYAPRIRQPAALLEEHVMKILRYVATIAVALGVGALWPAQAAEKGDGVLQCGGRLVSVVGCGILEGDRHRGSHDPQELGRNLRPNPCGGTQSQG